jgi:SAM-dependent methyltransferase
MEKIGLRKGKKKAIHTFGTVSAQKGPITTLSKAYEDDIFCMVNSRKPLEAEVGERVWIAIAPYSEEMGERPAMTLIEMGSGHNLLDVTFESQVGPIKRLDIGLDDRGRAKNLKRGGQYMVKVFGKDRFFELFERRSIPSGKGKGRKSEPDEVGMRRMDAFRELAGVGGRERILDAATGIKDYLKHFAKKGCHLTLGNISPTILEKTEEWLKVRDAEFVQYDIEKDLPFDEGSYDLIICDALLEYTLNPLDALGRLAHVLKPGGKLLLLEPVQPLAPVDDFYPQDLWEIALWRPLKDPEYNPGTIETALKDMGLAYKDMRAIEFDYPIWEGERFVQSVALFERE